jgi:hypothetical protein
MFYIALTHFWYAPFRLLLFNIEFALVAGVKIPTEFCVDKMLVDYLKHTFWLRRTRFLTFFFYIRICELVLIGYAV